MPIATAHDEPFPFNNSYARLPERFFAQVSPTPVANPQVIRLNESLARELGLNPETLRTAEGVAVLGGNRVPENADPLAMAYAGFQFGHWVPQLGDGRAILLGELLGQDGVRRDIQLKGAGATDEPVWAPSFENMSSARPCTALACQRHGHSRR